MSFPEILTVKAIGSAVTGTSVSVPGNNITGTATRTWGDYLTDIVNVKSFGAKGDNSTNDTAAIQAAVNACMGNGLSSSLNKALFFPSGIYLVQPVATTKTISAATNNGGKLQFTVNNTTGLTTGMVCSFYGIGGITSYNKRTWGIQVDGPTQITLINSNGALAASFTSGGNVVPPCVQINNTWGARLFGAARKNTYIDASATTGACPISTNGFGYSTIEHISFQGSTANGGRGFTWDWDQNSNLNWVSSQAVAFRDVEFGGDIGMIIGSGQAMCSESVIIMCHFAPESIGIYVCNANSLSHNIYGGQVQGPAGATSTGIHILQGAAPIIHGMGFQLNDLDIRIEGGAGDGYSIAGCRTESVNFLQVQPAFPVTVSGCLQTAGADGFFIKDSSGLMNLIGNYSVNGKVQGNGQFRLENNFFGRSDWNSIGGSIVPTLDQQPYEDKTADYTLKAGYAGTIYSNRGASGTINFSLPVDGSTPNRVPKGITYRFRILAAQTLRVTAGASSTIRDAGSTSSSAGNISANTIGNWIDLECQIDGGTEWLVVGKAGTWTLA